MTASAASEGHMGQDRIRYLVFVQGRWRWRPTKAMRGHGFKMVNLSRGVVIAGRNYPSAADRNTAMSLNEDWDRSRLEPAADSTPKFPRGSIGDGYLRAIAIRGIDRAARGIVPTKDQEKRDDWPRAWKWISIVFGDVDPMTVSPEDIQSLRNKVAESVSESEAHRVVKVWRALWKKMAAMGYCVRDADPSLTFANSAPQPRSSIWSDREAKKLVQGAWRLGYEGLAALMAVAWDSQFSPVDARSLTPAQWTGDLHGGLFYTGRAKTGRAAAGTLSVWAEAIVHHYVTRLGIKLMPDTPIFRTRNIPAVKGKNRHYPPVPYTQDRLVKDFAKVRAAVFGQGELRQLQDMRRSGAIEATAGGADPLSLSSKMANTLSASTRLQKTYLPVSVATVREVDANRVTGRGRIKEQKADESVTRRLGEVSRSRRPKA